MGKISVINLLGKRAQILSCEDSVLALEDIKFSIKSDVHSSILLPTARGDYFTVGQPTETHRRGRAMVWPLEAQSPPAGDVTNGNGRVYSEAVLNSFEYADRVFRWRPDGVTESAVSADVLLGESLKGLLSKNTEVGLVVPDGMEESNRQSIIDSCSPYGNVWLVPQTMAGAISWCRSQTAVKYKSGTHDDKREIGYVIIFEAGLGTWAISAIPIYRIKKGGRNWLVPKRVPKLRRIIEGITGWGLLSRQAVSENSRPPMTVLNDPNWVLSLLDGNVGLDIEAISKMMPNQKLLPSVPGLSSGEDWSNVSVQLTGAVTLLRSELKSPIIGVDVIGVMSDVNISGDKLRGIIKDLSGVEANGVKVNLLNIRDTDIVAGAALALAGRVGGTPTWFETLEDINLFYRGENELGDPVAKWASLLPGTVMDAGRDYEREEPILGLSVPVGMNEIALTLRHNPSDESLAKYRTTSVMQSKVCIETTPIRIDVTAKPGQGFATVIIKSIESGYFSGKLDWNSMKECKEPVVTRGYTMTVQLIAHPQIWDVAEIELVNLLEYLEGNHFRSDIAIDKMRSFLNTFNKSSHSLSFKPKGYNNKLKVDNHIYYGPVDLNGKVPTESKNGQKLLNILKNYLVDLAQNDTKPKISKMAQRLGGWYYLGCPEKISIEVLKKIDSLDTNLSQIDLHIVGQVLFGHNSKFITNYIKILDSVLPSLIAPNNWLRAFRNIVKLNEHALRDIDNGILESIVDALLDKLRGAITDGKRNIASNCYQSILFLLKRRRYSKSFLSEDDNRYKQIIDCLEDMEKKRFRGGAFLTPVNKRYVESLRKFLNSTATEQDENQIIGHVEECLENTEI
jgi:hypothetical protein